MFLVAFLTCVLLAQSQQATRDLPSGDNLKHVRQYGESAPQKSEGRPWDTGDNENVQKDQSTPSQLDIRDKPGIFFPDDINPWTPWAACSGGVQTRTRGPPEYAKQMRCGHLECVQTKACRLEPTVRSSEWAGWGQWSECSLETSGRIPVRTRKRQCDTQPERSYSILYRSQGNLGCLGSAYEMKLCDVELKQSAALEWTPWSLWSSCEYGSQFRTRSCPLSNRCVGISRETQYCALPSGNSMDRTWGQWLLCSNPSLYNFRYCEGMASTNNNNRIRTSQQRSWKK